MDDMTYDAAAAGSERSRIVGRQRELDQLRRGLSAALDGHGGVVLIGGEAGIGKTTLVSLLSRQALEDGALILSGHCYDLTATPPYGPWLEITDRYQAGAGLPELPDVLRRGTDIGELSNQIELFEVMRSFFADLSTARPLVLILEDLHWSDPASLDLLRYLARQLDTFPMLLVITYREDEVTAQHPLYPLIPLIVREANAERIDLRQFSDADVRALVEERYALPSGDAAALTAYLVTHADGNPLYIREMLRALEEDGFLRRDDNNWSLGSLDRGIVPPLIRQMIAGRASRLSEETRGLLAVAAVIGQEASIDLWNEVSASGDSVLLNAIEEAIGANFIQVTPNGASVRFVHALVREAIYEGILPIRRRRLHLQVAEHLAARRQPNVDAIADHFQRAGDSRAIEWLISAGDRAYRAYAWSTTIERFDAAAQLMADAPGLERERGWLIYRTGRMLRMSRPAEGVPRLQEAARIARASGDDVLAAYALADSGLVRCFADDIRRGIDEMAAGVAALDLLPTDHLSRDPSIATWIADALRKDELLSTGDTHNGSPPTPHNVRRSTLALWQALIGRHAEAIINGETSLQDVARTTRMTEVAAGLLGDAYHALGFAYAELGRRDDADAAFNQAREIYRSFDHHELVSGAATNHLWVVACPYFATDLAKLRWLVAEAEAARLRGHGALGRPITAASSGTLALIFLAGWWADAREAIDAGLEQTNAGLRSYAVCTAAYVAWGQGDDDMAWQHIRETLADGPYTKPGGRPFSPALELQRLAINLALGQGDLDRARAWLEAQDRWLVWGGAVRRKADAQLLWGRFHHARGDVDTARQHASEALRLASDPEQPLVLLAVQRFLGQLDTDAGRDAEAEQHLHASLALADACAAPFERALSLLNLAELRVSTGAIDEAHVLADEVRSICEPLGARPTIARLNSLLEQIKSQPAGNPAGLSDREVEVLRLVAQGLTDAEVAERLFIARRTVNTHLTSIYTKLAVNSRSAATRFAVEHGLT